MRKRKPFTDADILRFAVEPDIDLECDRALHVSNEDVDAALEARGEYLDELEARFERVLKGEA